MAGPIEHVIVLMLENRSFDHLLAYSGIADLTGVDTSKTNPAKSGPPVPMSATTPDRMPSDPGHEFENVDWQIYGQAPGPAARSVLMNGFANQDWPEAMACASPALVPVLTHLAREFVVCDNWFSSMPGPTWPNRFFVHAGSSGGLANSPSSMSSMGAILWSKLGFSFENGTLFDALTRAGHGWRVYHGDHFPQVCAIDTMPSVFVATADCFRKLDELGTDLQRGDVASYTFIEPDYSILSSFANGNSQHPAGSLSAGEQLIQTVAQAVMSSEVWMSSLLIIVYDEHGGFYDQVATPITGVIPPGDAALNTAKAASPPSPPFAFDRLGVRVPAVLVSPWLEPGTVSHSVYDHASVIRTIFDIFDLPGRLTNRDGKATSLAPLLAHTARIQAPAPVPAAKAATQAGSLTENANPRYVRSLDGFARIAAQIHHALRRHQAAPDLPSHALTNEIAAAEPDLSYLESLPLTGRPEEARAYIKHVADLIAIHRQRQRAGLPP